MLVFVCPLPLPFFSRARTQEITVIGDLKGGVVVTRLVREREREGKGEGERKGDTVGLLVRQSLPQSESIEQCQVLPCQEHEQQLL